MLNCNINTQIAARIYCTRTWQAYPHVKCFERVSPAAAVAHCQLHIHQRPQQPGQPSALVTHESVSPHLQVWNNSLAQLNWRHMKESLQERNLEMWTLWQALQPVKPKGITWKTHTGEKPFKCNLGHMSFIQLGSLQDHHKRRHERTFKCKYYENEFNSVSGLTVHKTSHYGEKHFKCKILWEVLYWLLLLEISWNNTHRGETFQVQVLWEMFYHNIGHERKHNGEKPFKCKCFGEIGIRYNIWIAYTVFGGPWDVHPT